MTTEAKQPSPDAWRHALNRSPIFRALAPERIAALAAEARERPMQRGEVLFRRGDRGEGMMAILAGEVRISIGSADGREQVIRKLGPGAVFGEIALLDGGARTADAVADTNGRLLVLERRSLHDCMARDPALAQGLIEMLCDRLRTTSLQLETHLFHDVVTRLADVLLGLAADRPSGSVDVTQSALGDMVGATRESVNKRLRDWEKAGWVQLQPGRVTLRDPARLAALLPQALTSR